MGPARPPVPYLDGLRIHCTAANIGSPARPHVRRRAVHPDPSWSRRRRDSDISSRKINWPNKYSTVSAFFLPFLSSIRLLLENRLSQSSLRLSKSRLAAVQVIDFRHLREPEILDYLSIMALLLQSTAWPRSEEQSQCSIYWCE
jgi:hypothetical protein